MNRVRTLVGAWLVAACDQGVGAVTRLTRPLHATRLEGRSGVNRCYWRRARIGPTRAGVVATAPRPGARRRRAAVRAEAVAGRPAPSCLAFRRSLTAEC